MTNFKSLIIYILLIICYPINVNALTQEEDLNIEIFKTRSLSAVSITTTVLSHDFQFKQILEDNPGAGSIIDKKGHILTNYHVIEYADKLTVTLHDGSLWKAKITGIDNSNDIAVIKINTLTKKLNPVEFGDSSTLNIGQKVLAIGNPFGLHNSLSTGIISSLSRTIKARNNRPIHNILQTDASINPGNSGGPLFDTNGKMIGINTALMSFEEGSIGVGFAIPINIVKFYLPQLLTKGFVSRPWIGIIGLDVTEEMLIHLNIKSKGILISEVIQKGPAHKAGLKGGTKFIEFNNQTITTGGDLIISINGIKIEKNNELEDYIESKKIGSKVKITIIRNNKKSDMNILLMEAPKDPLLSKTLNNNL